MKKANKLPASDALPLPFSTVCLVGQTRPLTAEEFPDVARKEGRVMSYRGENKPYSWNTFTTRQNTVCWGLVQYLDSESSKVNDAYRNSEWSPEAAAAMCDQVRDFPVISGGDKPLTLGDIIDWTPKELISKVMLEEKVFKIWHGCRTHATSPSGGAGATNAMHDAITLANYLNALPLHPTGEEISEAFQAYQDERMPWVQEAFDTSKVFKTMTGPAWMAKVARFCVKHIPAWVQCQALVRMSANRPQVEFLPRAEDRGSIPPAPQPSLTATASRRAAQSEIAAAR
ncbi:hypothetical protein BGX23_005552 [Mortierella sp. AD031]|nr:hypothetical protein BGX23_005552 [Mortierella sp. AD031]